MSDPGLSADDALLLLKRELERPPFNAWMAPVALAADPVAREVLIALPYRSEFSHDPDHAVYHGGVLATLVDVAGHAAVAVWHGSPTPTISLQIEYLAPALGGELRARGILRKLGRSISRADVEVSAGGKLVALGRGVFSTAKRG